MANLSKRPKRAADVEPEPVQPPAENAVGKGRPTPKRRSGAKPVKAPTTRKEAVAWQKEQRLKARSGRTTGAAKFTSAKEYREAVRRGEEDVLPKRDRGPAKRLARDYVDSRRLMSNYLLWLFIPMVLSTLLRMPVLNLIVLVVFATILTEWFLTGRRVKRLAEERFGSVPQSAMGLGFYAGSRAYLPRKWRIPMPQVEMGDEI